MKPRNKKYLRRVKNYLKRSCTPELANDSRMVGIYYHSRVLCSCRRHGCGNPRRFGRLMKGYTAQERRALESYKTQINETLRQESM